MLELKKVSEQDQKNEPTLFWNFIKQNGVNTQIKETIFNFFPRPYDGRDYLKGFQIIFNCDGTWKTFFNTVLINEDFIKAYWGEFRLSFNPDKYWYKILDTFGFLEGNPYGCGENSFSQVPLPTEYRKKVISIVGNIEAWDFK